MINRFFCETQDCESVELFISTTSNLCAASCFLNLKHIKSKIWGGRGHSKKYEATVSGHIKKKSFRRNGKLKINVLNTKKTNLKKKLRFHSLFISALVNTALISILLEHTCWVHVISAEYHVPLRNWTIMTLQNFLYQ